MNKNQAKEEKRARLKALQARLKAMTDDERQALIEANGAIATIEGRLLSPRNTMMVILQKRGSSVVGGYQQWIKAGRQVAKGEKGITILVPCARKNAEDENDRFFIARPVFDISQTEEIAAQVAA